MRILTVLLFIACLTASQMSVADELDPDLPGADGVTLEPWTSAPLTIGASRLTVTIPVPEGWDVVVDGPTILVTPPGSEHDLGLLFVAQSAAETPADSIQKLAGSYFESVSSEMKIDVPDQNDRILNALEGRFPDGRPAGLLGMNAQLGTVELVAIAGSAQTVFAPWKGILQDILLSSTITEIP